MGGQNLACCAYQRMLKDEVSRCDDTQAKLLRANVRVQTLEAAVAKVQSDYEETHRMMCREQTLRRESEENSQNAEHELGEAEKRYERAEEALETSRRLHTREKEQWKRDTAIKIEKEVAAEKAKSKTMWDQIRKEVSEEVAAKEAQMMKGMEDQIRNQLAEERKMELAQVNDEKERLKRELKDVTREKDQLLSFCYSRQLGVDSIFLN